MNRIPPTLLYLTIFNPTLPPTGLPFEDEEDAEEQAHIIFYTSRERAVSRDRMLRQVGLAKALINFSELFNANEACNNAHAQSRRMAMVSPEPNFWIHAGIELAHTPRSAAEAEKDKAKGKQKEKEKTKPNEKKKGKDSEAVKDTPSICDFHDGSVHDLAIRANLLWGYEQFKLTHGSFASILDTLGREALELQVERFFTVWAWSWEIEEGHDFGRHFGVPLHPHHRSLTPILDEFSSQLPDKGVLLVTSPHHIIPSTKFAAAHYPPVLSRHLLAQSLQSHLSTNSLAQPSPSPLCSPDGTAKTSPVIPSHAAAVGQSHFLRMSAMTLGLPVMNIGTTAKKSKVDAKKWNWSEYLTFGRSSAKKPPEIPKMDQDPIQKEGQEEHNAEDVQHQDAAVDKSALEDAISSNCSISESATNLIEESPDILDTPDGCFDAVEESSPPIETEGLSQSSIDNHIDVNHISAILSDVDRLLPSTPDNASDAAPQKEIPQEQPAATPEFLTTTIHLTDNQDVLVTRKSKIFYITRDHLTVMLIGMDSEGTPDVSPLVEPSLALVEKIKGVIDGEAKKSDSDIPSVTKILETDSKYIITAEHFTLSSPGFTSRSEHLYNAQQLLKKDFDISEVFSRGQNPQHWHVLRRGLGVDDKRGTIEGEVYMEVSRKETSLTDVDNDVSGLIRKCMR